MLSLERYMATLAIPRVRHVCAQVLRRGLVVGYTFSLCGLLLDCAGLDRDTGTVSAGPLGVLAQDLFILATLSLLLSAALAFTHVTRVAHRLDLLPVARD